MKWMEGMTRREVLLRGGMLTAGAVVCSGRLWGQDAAELQVASAGSIRPMLEGAIQSAVATALHLSLHVHGEGADKVAHAISSGSLPADVFVPITAGPMRTVMQAGKAETAWPVARTELALVYSPKSRFAPQLKEAAEGKAKWWEVLQEPGIRVGRGNPGLDPGARCIVFAMMLAAKQYGQPDLVEKVLGPVMNPKQIVPGVQAALHSGELDVSSTYRIGAIAGDLPYILLPKEINLSGTDPHAEHPEVSLSVDGTTYFPEALVYYAAALRDAANRSAADKFVEWMRGSEGQAVFAKHGFAAPGDAAAIHAAGISKETAAL